MTYARSDFERLFYALAPRGKSQEIRRFVSAEAERVLSRKRLRTMAVALTLSSRMLVQHIPRTFSRNLHGKKQKAISPISRFRVIRLFFVTHFIMT